MKKSDPTLGTLEELFKHLLTRGLRVAENRVGLLFCRQTVQRDWWIEQCARVSGVEVRPWAWTTIEEDQLNRQQSINSFNVIINISVESKALRLISSQIACKILNSFRLYTDSFTSQTVRPIKANQL